MYVAPLTSLILLKSGLRILIRVPEAPFLVRPKWQNGSFIDIEKQLLENIDKVNIATRETSQGITSLAI